jgi:zinc transport system substrate-binding protein
MIPGMLRLILRTITTAAVLTLIATACGGETAGGDDGDTIEVIATFYPLAEAAERTGGDTVSVTNLTPPGVEPHDLELTPDDLEAIARADVVVMLGGGFQPAVEEAVQNEANGIVVDVLEGITLLPPPAEHGHEGEEGGEQAHDDELASDPHVWLDPTLFAGVLERVGDALTQAGVDGAAVTQATEAATEDLAALDTEFESGLASCGSRIMLVNHAAFGYLAAAYDLTQEAISGLSPEAEPDPARLAELAEEAREEGVSTVFTESLVSPAVAETLAAEAGLATAVLNPLEGLTPEQETAGADYASVMRENLAALRGGLGCS